MIRVLIADDHRAVREGLRAALRAEPDIEVVGDAPDGQTALRLAHELRPDVVILDNSMPRLTGLELTWMLADALPQVRVVVFSMDEAIQPIALASGALFLFKGSARDDVVSTIRRAFRTSPRRGASALRAGPLASAPPEPEPSVAARLTAWVLDPAAARTRLVVSLACLAAYPIVFLATDPFARPRTALISLVPVLTAAGLLGLGGGLAVAAATLVLTWVLWVHGGYRPGEPIVELGDATGAIFFLAIGVAMGRMRDLRDRASRRSREVEALSEAAHLVAAGTLAGDTLHSVLEAARRVVPARYAMLWVPRDGDRSLELVAAAGGAARWLGHTQDAVSGIVGAAFRAGGPTRLADGASTSLPWIEGARSAVCAPIVLRGAVTGVLALVDDAPSHFGQDAARLLAAFASHVAIALEIESLLSTRQKEDRARAAAIEVARAHHGRKGEPLGEYLIARGLITPAQLDVALAAQRRLRAKGEHKMVGEILEEMHAITAGQLRRTVDTPPPGAPR